METLLTKIKTLCELMGFADVSVTGDSERRRVSVVIDDDLLRSHITVVIDALNHLVNLMRFKDELPPLAVDVNYYRKERERLIAELARVAAHKAQVTKEPVELPAMNAYERRLVHVEITTHPELTTESLGEGKERRVVIKRLDENNPPQGGQTSQTYRV